MSDSIQRFVGRVLVACEFSGIVRDAFAARGWDAWSCDMLPSERPGKHMQCDVRDILADGWDMMIAHPPCTHIAVSGAKHFAAKRADGRQIECATFFMHMLTAPIPKIAVENPVGIMSRLYRKPDQIIHPWQFGHECTKATCLWLKGLPKLKETNVVGKGIRYVDRRGKSHGSEFVMRAKVGYSPLMLLPKTPDRWKIRSRTFEGIADAMADQWTTANAQVERRAPSTFAPTPGSPLESTKGETQ